MSAIVDVLRRKLEGFALEEVSSRSLGVIRILLPLNIFNEYAAYLVMHKVDAAPEIVALVWIMMVANVLVMLGYKTRWSTIVWAVSFGILHLYFGRWLGQLPRMVQPVQAFQCIMVLTLAPSGRSLSIDRALEVRRARAEGREPEPERTPAWAYDLIALSIASIYFWAALDKTDPAWWRGERMEMYWIKWFGSSDSLMQSDLVHPIAVFFAGATTILEFSLAFGLVLRRTRPWVVLGGYLLHIGIALTLAVTYFSFKMMVMLFACVPPRWVHQVLGLVFDEAPNESVGPREPIAGPAGPEDC